MSKTLIPEIRFKGYTDEWEILCLGEVGFFKSNGVDKKSNPDEIPINLLNYMDVYNRRHITAKNVHTLMHVTAKPHQLTENDVRKGDVFFTPSSESPEDVGHCMVIDENLPQTCYSYHIMRYRPYTSVFFHSFPNYGFECYAVRSQLILGAQGVQRYVIRKEVFDNLSCPTPSMAEQQAIGEYFSNLDLLIAETERELDRLEKMKIASLQKMFPRPGATTPEVRFKGFVGEWRKCKLGELLTQRIEHQKISEEEPLLAFSYAEGVIDPENKKSNKRDFLMTDKDNKIFSRTEVDDIIYNPANVIHGAIHRNALKTGVVSPIYKIFICNDGVSPKYMGYRLRTSRFIREIEKFIEGTVIKLRTLSPESFLNMEIEIPLDLDEQIAIGEYFCNLDALIAAKREKLAKLRNIKKSCLDKMFVNTSDL